MNTRRLVGTLAIGLLVGVLLAPSPPGLAQATDWSSLIQAAKPAVVYIKTDKGHGSGAIISPDGYILTAFHVIKGAGWITLLVEDTREYAASVVATDESIDVAVLKIPASGLTWLALGDSEKVRYDEEVRALGYPWPQPVAGRGFAASAGKVEGFRTRDATQLIQFTATVNPGNSGGPLINGAAEIIGVVSELWSQALFPQAPPTPFALAVAISTAKRIIPAGVLPTGPSPVRPATGPAAVNGPIRVPQDQATLAAALRAAPEGGEIQVPRGTYRGDVYITKSVTITGEAGAVIEGTVRVSAARAVTLANLEVRGAVEIRDTTSFTLDQVTVKRSPGDGVVIEASTGLITGCTVEDAQGSGIVASFGARVTITNTVVRRSAKAGISLTLNTQARITGCTIEGNGADGLSLGSSTAEIHENTIRYNAGWGIASRADSRVAPTDPGISNVIERNAGGNLCGFGSASFHVTDVSISPTPPFQVGTTTRISATVTNVGAESAACSVKMTIDPGYSGRWDEQKKVVETVDVLLGPCESKRVDFSYTFYASTWVIVSISDQFGPRKVITVEVWSSELLRTLEGHTSYITSLAFSPDGKILASGSDDRTIKLWEVGTGLELRTLSGHTAAVTSVAFSPDGRFLASGSYDETAKVWNVLTGEEVHSLDMGGSVGPVAFSPDSTLAILTRHRYIDFWEPLTWRSIKRLEGVNGMSIAFSPNGRVIACGTGNWPIYLWDTASLEKLSSLHGQVSPVNTVAFSPDGTLLASGSAGEIKLWLVRHYTQR